MATVSVVILTYNAKEFIEKQLDLLQAQTLQNEIIVIDSQSTDGTLEILLAKRVKVHQIDKALFNHGATRNLGINLSSHDTIFFLTQDSIPYDKHSLQIIYEQIYADNKIALGYGRQLPREDASVFSAFARLYNYPSTSIIKDATMIPIMGIRTCSNSNSFAVYKKDLLLEIGGFPDNIILGEDVTVAAKFILQGKSILYSGDSRVIHSHEYSFLEEFKRYFDIGVFHCQQKEILSSFYKADSEGLKYVIAEARYVIKNGICQLIPFAIRTLMKLIGYKLGLMYIRLPKKFVKRFSMHAGFWESY